MNNKKKCILILGMHRSGTSALTGLLDIFEVYLGQELMKATKDNPKGYFENSSLHKVNEDILREINSSWNDIFFDINKLNNIDLSNLKKTIEDEFKYSNLFAIKDPRIALLFPLYEKVFNELNIEIKVIIPYRNPLEVANSLKVRNGICLEQGLILWSYHFLLAEKFSRNYARVFVEFSELINNSKDCIKLISEKLAIDFISKYKEKKEDIISFIEPNLKHHNLEIDTLSNNTPKVIKDILSFKSNYNNSHNENIEKFNQIYEEFFSYKELFLNQDIFKNYIGFLQTKDLIKKDRENTIKLSLLEETLNQKNLENRRLQDRFSEILKREKETLDETLLLKEQNNKSQNFNQQLKQEIEEQKKILENIDNNNQRLIINAQQKTIELQKLTAIIEEQKKSRQKYIEDNNKLNTQVNNQKEALTLYTSKLDEYKKQIQQKEQYVFKYLQQEKDIKHYKNNLEKKEQELSFYKNRAEKEKDLEIELASLLTSKSWIITRPLRKIMGLFK